MLLGAPYGQVGALEPGLLIVGSPARAIRALTDAEIAALVVSAAHYAAKAAHYAASLKLA